MFLVSDQSYAIAALLLKKKKAFSFDLLQLFHRHCTAPVSFQSLDRLNAKKKVKNQRFLTFLIGSMSTPMKRYQEVAHGDNARARGTLM